MNRLTLSQLSNKTVTLQEACKSVYTGLDLNGPRDVLLQLPGIKLYEMETSGSCCGSWAIECFPESGIKLREKRLNESAQTGADLVATVCHYCNQTFVGEAQKKEVYESKLLGL